MNKKHGEFEGGKGSGSSPEYNTWLGMKARCDNPNLPDFKNWGGRGITYCVEWKKFSAFLRDMGRRPTPQHTLGRKDNAKGYSPKNCEWQTRIVQGRDKRSNKLTNEAARQIRLLSNERTRKDLSRMFGVTLRTIYYVLQGHFWKEEASHQ
jgi:hypothetical protein